MSATPSRRSAPRRSPQPAAAHRRQPRRRTPDVGGTLRDMLIGAAIGAATFTVLAAATLLSFYLYFQLSGRILLGVSAGGVRLGNATAEEAAERLDAAWGSQQGSLTLTDGARSWPMAASELGLTLDASATAQRALAVGRGADFITEIATLTDALLTGYEVEPAVALDEDAARAALEDRSADFATAPQNASIRFEDGQAIAVPGVAGRALDVEATVETLAVNPGVIVRDGELPLTTAPVEPRIGDASAAVAEAQQLLRAPLTVVAYDPIEDERIEWTAEPATIATWLEVEEDDEGLSVTVSPGRLAAGVDDMIAELGQGRTIHVEDHIETLLAALRGGTTATLTVIHEPTSYTVQSGDTLTAIAWKVGMPWWRIRDANPGVDVDALTVGQTLTIPSKNDLLPLPVVADKRIVVDISEQRAWAYQDGEVLREFVISTGIDRSPTQPGVFQVQTHENPAYASIWDLWMPHFLGIYEAWPGFMNGFHGLPTLSGGSVLWADVLGSPASYGCIILGLDEAAWLYDWAEAGVVVVIQE